MKTAIIGLSLAASCNAFVGISPHKKPRVVFQMAAEGEAAVPHKDVTQAAMKVDTEIKVTPVVNEAKAQPVAEAKAKVVEEMKTKVDDKPITLGEIKLPEQAKSVDVAKEPIAAQPVSAPSATKTEQLFDIKPMDKSAEVADANKSIDDIHSQIAKLKEQVDAGTLDRKAYIAKLDEYSGKLDQVISKMEGVKSATSSHLDQINQALAQMETATQQALSKIGGVSIEVASNLPTDMF